MYIHECRRSTRGDISTLAVIIAVVVIAPVMNAPIFSFGIDCFHGMFY